MDMKTGTVARGRWMFLKTGGGMEKLHRTLAKGSKLRETEKRKRERDSGWKKNG